MNRTDLFTHIALDMIDPVTLNEFVSTVRHSGPIAAAPLIIESFYDHIVTPRYELIPTESGVIGRTLSGATAEMTWIEIATLLANAATPERVDALGGEIANAGSDRSTGGDYRPTMRALEDYVHAAAVAGGLIDPVSRHDLDNGFDLQLRSNRHRTKLLINDVELLDVRPQQFTAHVGVRPHQDPRARVEAAGFEAMVVFVPHGESNTPKAASAADRVGVERLDPNGDVGARWVLQIDGYDTVAIEAFADSGVRVAVYDSNPDERFLRFDKSFPINPRPSPAEHRLAKLSFPRPGRAL